MKRLLILLVAVLAMMAASAETIKYVKIKTIHAGQTQNFGKAGAKVDFNFNGNRLTGPVSMYGFKYSHTDKRGNRIYYCVGTNIVPGGGYGPVQQETLDKENYVIVEPGGQYINHVWGGNVGPDYEPYTDVYKRYVAPTPGAVVH